MDIYISTRIFTRISMHTLICTCMYTHIQIFIFTKECYISMWVTKRFSSRTSNGGFLEKSVPLPKRYIFLNNTVAMLKREYCISALMQDALRLRMKRRYIYMYIHLFFGQCSGYKKTCCLSALMQDALRVHMKRCVSQKNWPSSLEICVCKAHTKFSGS